MDREYRKESILKLYQMLTSEEVENLIKTRSWLGSYDNFKDLASLQNYLNSRDAETYDLHVELSALVEDKFGGTTHKQILSLIEEYNKKAEELGFATRLGLASSQDPYEGRGGVDAPGITDDNYWFPSSFC